MPPVASDEFYKPHEPLDATKYRGDCPQLEIGSENFKGSEDCLHLNVFSPDHKFTGDVALPVMVWIHGGGFLVGSSDPSFYGPARFLDYDIVLVTINYRLGALGFLTSGGEDAPANNGIQDQLLALRWVKENIKDFGGDPDKVTIFGESAGASSVLALMSSPRANGLFHQAIAMDGSYNNINPLLYSSRSVPHYTSLLALELSCPTKDSLADGVQCLRGKPAEEIIRKANLFTQYNFLNNPFKPAPTPPTDNSSEKTVLPYSLDNPWQENTPFDIPVIIGGNKDAGILSYVDFLNKEELHTDVRKNFAVEAPVLLLNADPDVAETDESETATAQVLMEKYLKEKKFSKEAAKEIVAVLTDAHHLAPLDKTVDDLVKAKKSPTYYYNYQHKGSFTLPLAFGARTDLGVCQTDELFLMFRHDEVSRSWFGDLALQTEEDITVSRKMLEMWTTFAITGNPTPSGTWKPAGNDEEFQFAVLDSDKLRMEYPTEFSERMTFARDMLTKIYNHRHLNLAEHPELAKLIKEKEELGREETSREATKEDWGIKDNDSDKKDQEKDTSDEGGAEEEEANFYSVEDAMKFLMDLEGETGEQIRSFLETARVSLKKSTEDMVQDAVKDIWTGEDESDEEILREYLGKDYVHDKDEL